MQVSRLATLFAQREGFGIAGAVPTRDNNPGDLRHAPGAQHAPNDPDGIGKFDTIIEGWAALERQLELYASRGLSLEQAVFSFAPPSENDSQAYLDFITQRLPAAPDTPMRDALSIGDPVQFIPEAPAVLQA
jgi:hypothetical protein